MSLTYNPPQLVEKDTGSMIKASYIYNFGKLVSWPESQSKGNFTIGILGDPSLYQQLITKYSGKKYGSQAIEIVQMVNAEKLGKPQILFVSRKNNEQLEAISKELAKSSTLLISEFEKGLEKGATLNFVVVDNQVKFEISEPNAAAHKLTVGSTLKSLAHNRWESYETLYHRFIDIIYCHSSSSPSARPNQEGCNLLSR